MELELWLRMYRSFKPSSLLLTTIYMEDPGSYLVTYNSFQLTELTLFFNSYRNAIETREQIRKQFDPRRDRLERDRSDELDSNPTDISSHSWPGDLICFAPSQVWSSTCGQEIEEIMESLYHHRHHLHWPSTDICRGQRTYYQYRSLTIFSSI